MVKHHPWQIFTDPGRAAFTHYVPKSKQCCMDVDKEFTGGCHGDAVTVWMAIQFIFLAESTHTGRHKPYEQSIIYSIRCRSLGSRHATAEQICSLHRFIKEFHSRCSSYCFPYSVLSFYASSPCSTRAASKDLPPVDIIMLECRRDNLRLRTSKSAIKNNVIYHPVSVTNSATATCAAAATARSKSGFVPPAPGLAAHD